MYAPHFGLAQAPFSIAPDPRYLYMSERHREALAHLLYGLQGGGGFVLLTGEIGAGKTTVCRCFLEQVPPRCNVAYIFNPRLTVDELLATVAQEFRIPGDAGQREPTLKDRVDALNEYLLRTHAVGQNNVLVIDEAQNLSADVLEQLRLLTNLETRERKLLQIVLIGQPELRTMLARPELEQLAQRVIARYHLGALSSEETAQYVRHRLAVAGLKGALPFDRRALARIHALSRGVPRRINLLADRALLGAYALGRTTVGRSIVDQAAGEVFDRPSRGSRAPWLAGAAAAGAALLVAGWVGGSLPRRDGPAVVPAAVAASAPALPASTAATAAAAASAPAHIASEDAAWRQLATRWAVELDGTDPCEAAPSRRLACHRIAGADLALLRRLDRPGIVTLHDGGAARAYALLTALGPRHVELHVDGAARTVSQEAFARAWHGDFATFWRPPAGWDARAPGMATERWLQARLPRGEGEDTSLVARVRAFQRAQGLDVDGLAGPLTLMRLNRSSGVDEPTLRTLER